MEYRRLGRAGVKVSTISLGSWLTYSKSIEDQTAIQCIHRAYELGINFFDTANVYNLGEAEKVVGRALQAFPRESYVLASKVFHPMGDGPNDRGLSRKHIMEQCHASLKRLGTDYIDLYQCHRYDPETPLDEVLRALDDLITQGKVLYVGVSEWTATQIADAVYTSRALNLDQIVSNQPMYNMLSRFIEHDVIPLCEREGIGQVVFSPLAQGVLTGKYRPGEQPPVGSRAADSEINYFIKQLFMQDRTLSAIQHLQALAAEGGYTLAQLALAWTLSQKNVSSAIIGASRPEQIEENVKASTIKLSAEVLQRIDSVLEGLVSYEKPNF
ncbi:aldo/keto reductase [Ktedonosporobacter rubrisoli]|uniref:Aldo/keto reductase n=1 Tax=Ktedonosporobacter rubrisoli TaxID=2509675 RepID=A0A4V0YYE9_KTERU|nr:aldo/keto reductase family protein [Ktedonosporobacter rubrisoli]QBD75981.1 aldo/keto reductase [Ktedonosporobacter rubrisoli]